MDLPRITGYVLVGLLGIALWPMSAIAVVMTESLDNLYPELGQALCSARCCIWNCLVRWRLGRPFG